MGDRGNIVFQEYDNGTIYMYTHWGGSELPQVVARALDRGRDRWNDEPYLARILFSELVKDDIEGDTGYGLSTTLGDGSKNVYIFPSTQTVRFKDEDLSFNDFIIKHAPWDHDEEVSSPGPWFECEHCGFHGPLGEDDYPEDCPMCK